MCSSDLSVFYEVGEFGEVERGDDMLLFCIVTYFFYLDSGCVAVAIPFILKLSSIIDGVILSTPEDDAEGIGVSAPPACSKALSSNAPLASRLDYGIPLIGPP